MQFVKAANPDRRVFRAVQPDVLRYDCQFFAITRRSPQASRATQVFQGCLAQTH